jgi:hypothetical protein
MLRNGEVIRSVQMDRALASEGRVSGSNPVGCAITCKSRIINDLRGTAIPRCYPNSPDGHIVGAVRQTNMVPENSLAKTWGDSAVHVADGAAIGIFNLVEKLR